MIERKILNSEIPITSKKTHGIRDKRLLNWLDLQRPFLFRIYPFGQVFFFVSLLLLVVVVIDSVVACSALLLASSSSNNCSLPALSFIRNFDVILSTSLSALIVTCSSGILGVVAIWVSELLDIVELIERLVGDVDEGDDVVDGFVGQVIQGLIVVDEEPEELVVGFKIGFIVKSA